ncbi:MAG: type VII toxin-antitoxin system HepT family RNase toxin [Caldimicrobium sp.]
MRIIELISRFVLHLSKARENAKKDVSDYYIYTALAMECFQAVNTLIEIGEWIVAEKRLGFPSTYREIFELLYKEKIIDKPTLESIKRLIFLRNLISHEYYKITENELLEMVELLEHAERFVNEVKKCQI